MTTPKDKSQAEILAEQVYPNDSCEGLVATREQQHLRMAYAKGYAAGQAAQLNVVAWVPEDELPASLPSDAYNALYPHSRVDFIRLFPVFVPPANP